MLLQQQRERVTPNLAAMRVHPPQAPTPPSILKKKQSTISVGSLIDVSDT
jgi:hypothetical protein